MANFWKASVEVKKQSQGLRSKNSLFKNNKMTSCMTNKLLRILKMTKKEIKIFQNQ